ncbi:vanadium-dependent haloperoxidase [Aquimarina litoralis]|uniref:vanadium-dependent haloperoxidase n=1 Tax=Aquimarina litoralis TaxID=584605 RepID=UPI001C57B714|nr:vanadium-dependent haloperoxidase [Aquimarina litoralis]MBW1296457.1 phosphatase PAP2 family protein [Aquimarina litoralis]
MKSNNVKILLVAIFIVVLAQSCANDDNFVNIDNPDTSVVSDKTTKLSTDWNKLWLELDRYTSGMRPNATARALAYIHLAAYETAVADMDGYTSNRNRLSDFNLNPNERADNVDLDLALSTCYALVFDHFMYNVESSIKAGINQLKESKENELSVGLTENVIENSIEWGTYVAERVIAYSQTDTEAETQILDPQPFSYEPPVGDGFWTYSADAERAWFPYWGSVRTFVISSEETSSIPPPISYSEQNNSAYYNQMLEVYEVSTAARVDDNEDLWISEFWSDDVEGLMMSPPGRQISIAIQLMEQDDMGFEACLALFLKLGFSLNDVCVSTWEDKYQYMVMRPNVYINEFIDEDYQTNLYRFIFWPNPSFPGYPSGHSSFASAAAGIFIDHFGDTVSFTDRSHEGRTEFRSTPREFSSFSEMAEENAFSRVPFGVHIRMDCTEGLRLGYEVADAINDFNLHTN